MRRLIASLVVIVGLAAPACVTNDPPAAPVAAQRLRATYLGVGGFLVEANGEAVLTAPLFTRPSMIALGSTPVWSDPAQVERGLPTPALGNVRAVVSGHAHYDHLLDVPNVLARAPSATFFGNRSARNVLAAHAPPAERGGRCIGTPPAFPVVSGARVVALDDPMRSATDWTFCADRRPPNAPVQGTWVGVPGSHVRILAVCSDHPDQLGPIHYAPGGVEEPQCAPPQRADDWREGQTLAFLIDFLDPMTNAPAFRVYYQDAPSTAPLGHVPPVVLSEKRIDLAILCVGAYEHVSGAPTLTLNALVPRYALGGHWEDFFRPPWEPTQPLPFEDLNTWASRARSAMQPQFEPRAMLENGAPIAGRVAVPRPGAAYDIYR